MVTVLEYTALYDEVNGAKGAIDTNNILDPEKGWVRTFNNGSRRSILVGQQEGDYQAQSLHNRSSLGILQGEVRAYAGRNLLWHGQSYALLRSNRIRGKRFGQRPNDVANRGSR